MSCCNNFDPKKTVVIPSYFLYDEEIKIMGKSPEERKHYYFSLVRILPEDVTIIDVKGKSVNDASIDIKMVSCEGRNFTALISGGTLNTKAALQFSIYTSSEELIVFIASLHVRNNGTVKDENNHNYVILPGPQGEKGDTATLKIGKVSTGEPGTPVEIENVGTENDAILNITIPQGDKGKQGSVFLTGDVDPVSIDGIVTPAFFVNNQSGDFFYLEKDETTWKKKGNLHGPKGDQGKAATVTINSVTASEPGSNPSIINVGDDLNAKWDFVLPRGIQGTPGIDGKDGKDGKDGIDGITYLKGKNISFIGDSITTFAGNVVPGNATWYPSFDVLSVNDTWWRKFADMTGANILTNDSFSGSFVSNHGDGSLQTRFKVIDPKTDICLVLMGANDLQQKAPMGAKIAKPSFSVANNFNNTYFIDALCNAIVNLTVNYPKTKFIWMLPIKQFNYDLSPYSYELTTNVKDINKSYTDTSDNHMRYYIPINQSLWRGQYISQIRLSNANKPEEPNGYGNYTIMIVKNIGQDGITPTIRKQQDIEVNFSNEWRPISGEWVVGNDEYLAIQSNEPNVTPGGGIRTGKWYLSNSNLADGGFKYYDPSTKKWMTVQGDLNIGVQIKENHDVDDYCNAMIEIFTYYGVHYIDMRNLGITSMNANQYLGEAGINGFVHPLKSGMTLIARYVYSQLYGFQ